MKNKKFIKYSSVNCISIISIILFSQILVSFSAFASPSYYETHCYETDCGSNFKSDSEIMYPTITSAYVAGCRHCKPLFEFQNFNLLCKHAHEDSKFYWMRLLVDDVICDYSLYYGLDNLPYFAGAVGISALMANSKVDHHVRDHFHQNIRNPHHGHVHKRIDNFAAFSHMRIYVASIMVGYWFKDDWAGDILYRWGNRALRAYIIASPQVTLLRKVLGSGRPNAREGTEYTRSRWRLGKSQRSSVSGHTFNGAIPFITAGLMTDNLPLRYSLYAISTIPGLSRLHGKWHYFSQVFLGWSLSYLAARIVDIADQEKCPQVQLHLCPVKDGAMLYGKFDF